MVISGVTVDDAKRAFDQLAKVGITASELQIAMCARWPVITFWEVVGAEDIERREALWLWNRGSRRGRAAYPDDASLRTDARAQRPRSAGRMARAWRGVVRAAAQLVGARPRATRPVGSGDR